MLLIIAHHYVVNSGLTEMFDLSNISCNMVFLQLAGAWGKTVINCFSIITGYFMVNSKITFKKFTKILLQVEFYYVLFYILFLVLGYAEFSIKESIRTLLWFVYEPGNLYVGTYVLFYLFIPFLNVLVENINKKKFQKLLILLLTYFCVFSTFLKNETFDFLCWMAVCYMIGAYIRCYSEKKWDNYRLGMLGTILSITLAISSVLAIDFVGSHFGINSYYWFVADSNKLLALTTAMFSFIMFKNMNLRFNRSINMISSTTFGILLFHANGWPMRNFLWKSVFRNIDLYDSIFLPIHTVLSVLIVFCVGAFIEFIRIKYIEKIYLPRVYKSKWFLTLEKKFN